MIDQFTVNYTNNFFESMLISNKKVKKSSKLKKLKQHYEKFFNRQNNFNF